MPNIEDDIRKSAKRLKAATEGVKHTIFDDPGLLELLSQTKDWGAERPDDGHYGGLGYTLGEGGDWEDSDWGIQAGELAGDRPWGGSSGSGSGSDDEG